MKARQQRKVIKQRSYSHAHNKVLTGLLQKLLILLNPFGVPAGCMNCRAYINKFSCPPIARMLVARRAPITQWVLLAPWKVSSFLAISQQKSRGTKALTWYDSGFPRWGSDSDRDVHSGGFVQRWLNHPCHILLVVSIFWLLWHFLQIGAGKGVHRDTHTSTSLNLTLVLPKVEKHILLNTAQGGFREHMYPDAALLARFHKTVFFMEVLCRKVTDCRTTY